MEGVQMANAIVLVSAAISFLFGVVLELTAKSAMHETTAAIYIVGGLILFACCVALTRLAEIRDHIVPGKK
jgi:protein-S-isoprenylcysteine O-methyltransferase Ste14